MKKIKNSIITKHVNEFSINRKIKRHYQPEAGDVAIFKVCEIGKHKSVQGTNGNNCYIFPGDHIMAVFGNRYATAQFEGYLPDEYQSEYQILGQGGVVGLLSSMHEKFDAIGPTTVKLVGYATNKDGEVINTKYLHEEKQNFVPFQHQNFKTILSLGSSMDSGKTTTAAFMCRGLQNLKKKVAFIKLTGTVFAKDKSFVRDCGADLSIDFSTMGFPSTYLSSIDELLDLYKTLISKAEAINPDYVVIEIADGLLQRETHALINNPLFMRNVDGVMLSCGDSLSVMTGINLLESINQKPMLVSGLFTAAPLLAEEVKAFCEVPVFKLEDFVDPGNLKQLLETLEKQKMAA